MRIAESALSVRLKAARADFVPPPALLVTLTHPTRAGLDQSRLIERRGDAYVGPVRLPAAGHWLHADDPEGLRSLLVAGLP